MRHNIVPRLLIVRGIIQDGGDNQWNILSVVSFLWYRETEHLQKSPKYSVGMRPASCKPNPDFPHPISKSPTRDHLRFPPSGVGGGGDGARFSRTHFPDPA